MKRIFSSFRDPSGYLFIQDGILYRHIFSSYQPHYDLLTSSGLYQTLVDANLLIPHQEVSKNFPNATGVYKTIQPQRLPFIAYPYEWSFSQFKRAALATLEIQKRALEKGMMLKDASAYNIQFTGTQAVLIDTLSFEKYQEGTPWIAYRQFCQHFLAPLALMSQKDIRLQQLLRVHMDGIPLDLASQLLPLGTYANFSLLVHIHLHARTQKHFADKPPQHQKMTMSRLSQMALIDSLESAVKKLQWKPAGTEWGQYYSDTNYDDAAMRQKEALVQEYAALAKPKVIWDLGANTGRFSRLAHAKAQAALTLAFDVDPAAVEIHDLENVKTQNPAAVYPLLMDLTNPSGAIGWDGQERMALAERGPADLVMALALIHHLAISNNVPLEHLAAFFRKAGHYLVIEFVPKEDSQVQRLLRSREDIFTHYNQNHFETVFGQFFSVVRKNEIPGSRRTLYLMQNKQPRQAAL